jgi:lactate permease
VFPSHERRRRCAGEEGDFFGTLQTITARKLAASGVLPLGERQAMVLLAAANSTGGVMGKMINAQSIVVSATVE